VLAFAITVSSSNLPLFVGLVGFGFVVGTIGHIIDSRIVIMTGIIIVAMVTCYYVFVLQPSR